MFNTLKKWFYLKNLNKREISFLYKTLAVAIFIDNEINENELIGAKKNIKDFLSVHYKLLHKKQIDFFVEYIYENLLKELEKYKKNINYFTKEKNLIINYILELKEPNYFLKYIYDIFQADKKFVKEEQNFFNYLKKYVEG